ncbi:YSIRK-type signal peptide-containing protein, partial [Lactobacillus intestinalis]
MIFNKNDYDSKQRFSIRKLSVGVCSVLLSTLFLTINDNQTVHAATESDQQETEKSDSGNANRGLNIVTQSASQTQAVTTTEIPSKSTQSEDYTTEPTHSEASRNETSQTKTSGTETAQNSVEIQKDNVENTSATNHNNTIVQSTEKPSTVQKTKTSNPNSSTTRTESKTNSLTQNNPINDAKQKTNTLNVSNLVAKTNVNALQEDKTAATTATTNGGYDSATWGTLDTSKWTGQNTTFDGNNYYQLTGYTGDQTHIIVPNQADFEQAG